MATAPGTAYVQPLAAWRVIVNGTDLTATFAPRLIRLTLSQWSKEQADELSLELHDHDGALILPPEGASISLALGWAKGSGVTPGLIDKGAFVVDELTWGGPPDIVTIKGRSAHFATAFRTRKTRTWSSQTLGAITGKVATDNGLTARCHPDLAGTTIDAAEQHNQSDMELIRDLGRRYDAAATVKGGALIFSPVGSDTTATGKPLPTLPLTRQSGDRYSYTRAAREGAYQGAEANHYDQGEAKRKLQQSGSAPHRRLKRVYASANDAQAAAKAEAKRLKRAAARFELTLGYGDAAIAAGAKTTAQGFKTEVDAKTWLIAHVEHTMGAEGFSTKLEMEVAP